MSTSRKLGVLACLSAVFLLPDGAVSEQPKSTHWDYGTDEGPGNWAKLSPEFSLCGVGREQSPIDLRDATPAAAAPIEQQLDKPILTIDQQNHVLDLIDNGHTIQVSNVAVETLDLEGERFQLIQYHFHAPSEHTIDGEHAPLEVHFVHRSAAGKLAVIGALVEQGEHDSIFDPIIAALPTGPRDERHFKGLDIGKAVLMPLVQSHYRYEGSLTTPPCSEGVHWLVMRARRKMGPEQMKKLVSHLHHNNRPVQPLGDREPTFVSK
jgi:carbonic anhydrase